MHRKKLKRIITDHRKHKVAKTVHKHLEEKRKNAPKRTPKQTKANA